MSSTPDPIPAIAGTVYVVGSLNLDTALRVHDHPVPGQTVASQSRTTGAGGKGGNQAIAAALAGSAVVMSGAVGSDADGAAILDDLAAAGIDTAGIGRYSGPSGAATVVVDDRGENMIVVSPGANARVTNDAIDETLRTAGPGDTVVLQNEIPSGANDHAARTARASGAQVIWNAAPAPRSREEIPASIDVLVVNEGELLAVARLIGVDEPDPITAIPAVARSLSTDVVCTRGAAGASAYVDGTMHEVTAPLVDAVDTTAAGDTFVGYFAASSHLPVTERLRRASTAGGLAVTRPGAAASIPDQHAVAALLDRGTPALSKGHA